MSSEVKTLLLKKLGIGEKVKKTPILKISRAKQLEKAEEHVIAIKLMEQCEGRCMECGKMPDYKDGYGQLHLHHKIRKSHGGKSTMENCVLICRKCHNAAGGIYEKD